MRKSALYSVDEILVAARPCGRRNFSQHLTVSAPCVTVPERSCDDEYSIVPDRIGSRSARHLAYAGLPLDAGAPLVARPYFRSTHHRAERIADGGNGQR